MCVWMIPIKQANKQRKKKKKRKTHKWHSKNCRFLTGNREIYYTYLNVIFTIDRILHENTVRNHENKSFTLKLP